MKLLVNLFVPAISENYDIRVPNDMRIRCIVSLIAESVETLSGHRYVVSGGESLCSKEKNVLLRNNATLAQYGIKNGDRLILI